jgi:hypothetical protein
VHEVSQRDVLAVVFDVLKAHTSTEVEALDAPRQGYRADIDGVTFEVRIRPVSGFDRSGRQIVAYALDNHLKSGSRTGRPFQATEHLLDLLSVIRIEIDGLLAESQIPVWSLD